MTLITDFIEKNYLYQPKILVLGDCMIDEYYEVDVKRISPEAPIPVMRTSDSRPVAVAPGGAANVAHQFKFWNADCRLAGIFHSAVFEDMGLTTLPLDFISPAVPIKRRFQNGQSLIRWDLEDTNQVLDIHIERFLKVLTKHLDKNKYDVAILSDYDKGVFKNFKLTQQMMTLFHVNGIKTIVDPKDEPVEKWLGCTVFKPNSVEANKFTGLYEGMSQSAKLAERLLDTSIVITHGGSGTYCYNSAKQQEFHYESKRDVRVKSVIGAGDCFVSLLALAIAQGFTLEESVEIAYEAGAIYVQRKHNKPVTPLDLQDSKFVNPKTLVKRDFKLVMTNGCYDLFHAGHVESLEFAKSKGDKLLVAVNADDSVRALKGPGRPVIPLEYRKKMLASLECVDYVVDFSEPSPYNLAELIRPDVLVKGGDTKKTPRSAKWATEYYPSPVVDGLSTTSIINKIRNS
jgi:D-beta-D-heptose 7-phosphate kinase/D-beta-D-heptose 1-phosphate adenosyltransferase